MIGFLIGLVSGVIVTLFSIALLMAGSDNSDI